ncbi:hypothetical protein ADUPG1_001816, partial [Aduncisulcus paluster]
LDVSITGPTSSIDFLLYDDSVSGKLSWQSPLTAVGSLLSVYDNAGTLEFTEVGVGDATKHILMYDSGSDSGMSWSSLLSSTGALMSYDEDTALDVSITGPTSSIDFLLYDDSGSGKLSWQSPLTAVGSLLSVYDNAGTLEFTEVGVGSILTTDTNGDLIELEAGLENQILITDSNGLLGWESLAAISGANFEMGSYLTPMNESLSGIVEYRSLLSSFEVVDVGRVDYGSDVMISFDFEPLAITDTILSYDGTTMFTVPSNADHILKIDTTHSPPVVKRLAINLGSSQNKFSSAILGNKDYIYFFPDQIGVILKLNVHTEEYQMINVGKRGSFSSPVLYIDPQSGVEYIYASPYGYSSSFIVLNTESDDWNVFSFSPENDYYSLRIQWNGASVVELSGHLFMMSHSQNEFNSAFIQFGLPQNHGLISNIRDKTLSNMHIINSILSKNSGELIFLGQSSSGETTFVSANISSSKTKIQGISTVRPSSIKTKSHSISPIQFAANTSDSDSLKNSCVRGIDGNVHCIGLIEGQNNAMTILSYDGDKVYEQTEWMVDDSENGGILIVDKLGNMMSVSTNGGFYSKFSMFTNEGDSLEIQSTNWSDLYPLPI